MTDRANIYVDQSTDFRTPLFFSDSSGPVDMTDYNFYGQIRKIYSSTVVANFQFETVDIINGEIDIVLPYSISETLAPGKYQYDILIRNTITDETTKVVEGLLFIESTVTKIVQAPE